MRPAGLVGDSLHLGQPRARAGVVLGRQHLLHVAGAARRSDRLGLSVLADHHDEGRRRYLVGSAEHPLPLGLRTTRGEAGGAIVLDDCRGHLVGTVFREVEAGDHTLVLLRAALRRGGLGFSSALAPGLPPQRLRPPRLRRLAPISPGAPPAIDRPLHASPTRHAPVPALTPRRVGRLAASVGATIEWYDFFLYGTAAGLVFDKLFLPA